MKLKKVLFILLAVFTTMFGMTARAKASAPNSYTIAAKDLYYLEGSKYLENSTLRFTYKVTTDGKVIYCTEIHDSMPSYGTEKYTLSKEMDAKFAYVLANGYPTKSITGDKDKDYFITGLAVWYLISPNDSTFTYFDLNNGTYRGSSSDVVKEIAKLVNGAKGYSLTNPTLKINSSSTGLTLSSDGKYYVSSSIGVKVTGNISGNKYSVSLENAPSGTIVTDSKGNTKTSFGTSETFLVKIPVSSIKELNSSFKVNVSAKGVTYKAYLYTPTSSSAYQSTTTVYPEEKELKDSLTLKMDLTTEVEISKVDATTGKELPGATLVLKDAYDKVVETWVSGTEAHIIKGLSFGKYYLTEVYAPDGYILSTETIEFELSSEKTTVKVVMKNELKPDVPEVSISKQDATTGEELPGAHLELYDEDNNLIEAWVSGEKPHKVKGLKPGKYYLKETLAPEGYELTSETVEFVVKEDGTVDGKVIMYNKPETYIKVPGTSSFKTITASLIGIVIIGLGSIIIYKNYKKNEEN